LGEQSTKSARRRRVDVPTLQRQLRGDLDWITMKALEKDRERRYSSPGELAADIRRHMRREPVLAGAPSKAYRLHRFISRNRGPVAASASVFIVLLLAVAVTTSMFLSAREDRREARWLHYVSSIRAAALAASVEDAVSLGQNLDDSPEEYQGWEWSHLNYVRESSSHRLSVDDRAWLAQAFFHPVEDKLLAFSWWTGKMHVWNTRDFALDETLDLLSGEGREPTCWLEAVARGGEVGLVQSRVDLNEPPYLLQFQSEGKRIDLKDWPHSPAKFGRFSEDGSLVAVHRTVAETSCMQTMPLASSTPPQGTRLHLLGPTGQRSIP
jgi:hypothetical protein